MMSRRDLTFRVFVSSTFKDLRAERNALQQHVFPKLREYCQMRRARFQAIDLRWGVSGEASLDQQTMNICIQELERCQQASPRPNFIILLGQRYGWRPLPARIPAGEFEEILARVPESKRPFLTGNCDVAEWRDGAAVTRMGWYRKDMNAVPPEYVLQPRTIHIPEGASAELRSKIVAEEGKDWYEIEPKLLTVLQSAINTLGWTTEDPRRAKYERSATHQEIDHGALADGLSAEKHVFAYFRTIDHIPDGAMTNDFIDAGDDARDLKALKDVITRRLPREHVFDDYVVPWERIDARAKLPDAPLMLEENPDIAELCRRVEQDLRRIIDDELQRYKDLPELERERATHRDFAVQRSQGKNFKGRQDELNRIERYLADPEARRPLVVHGQSGTGKTALMAKAYLSTANSDGTCVRFIGATPGSADLRSLLRSLCQELGVDSPPSEMNDLVKSFRARLAGPERGSDASGPVQSAAVFLDALDQLNPTDNARMLYWLPRVLAPGVKLVVSTLEDTSEHTSVPKAGAYDPFDIARRIWPESLAELGRLNMEEGTALLESWLADAGRTLQKEQRDDILRKFTVVGLPLYLKVAFEEAKLWRSWDGLPCGADAEPGLSNTVDGILVDLLHRLEQPRNHGELLISRALGNIAAAKNGLTEDELLDVLSMEPDKAIMKWLHSQSHTEKNKKEEYRIDRVPIVMWSRLYADLRPYMVERRADGTVVMNFYHRQVSEAVTARYLDNEPGARLAAHERLAEYFSGLDYWAESLEAQQARAKRLPPTPRPANVRKVVELPYHRLEAAKLGGKDDPKSPYWDSVAELLLDWQFLEAKAEADPNFVEQEAVNRSAAASGTEA